MTVRHVYVFFYGLFMDAELLRRQGITPINPQRAYIENFALRIGKRATLTAAIDQRSYGMLMMLTHRELEQLYSAPGLECYYPEAVLAQTLLGNSIPALCYNLLNDPAPDERNIDYAAALQAVLHKLDFPAEYIASVS
jgi:hypothetical protein